jgi:mannose-6-phosphate isomerase-like protein (cupin superfamily)
MTSFSSTLVGFLAGLLVASIINPVQRQLIAFPFVHKIHDMISARGFPPVCYDSYSNWPLSAAKNLADMPPTQHPIPGLAHLTVAGRTHTGTRNIEMWYETVAPGHGTPIHKHDCEEVFLVLSGTGGTMRQQAFDGRVLSQKLGPNSTVTVLPNARHQFFNEGEEPVSFIVAFDNLPMRPVAFPSWDARENQGKVMAPLPWDKHCPPKGSQPDVLKLLSKVKRGSSSSGSGEEGKKSEL